MKIECVPTIADYRSAIKLHHQQSLFRRVYYFILTLAAPALAWSILGYLMIKSLLDRAFAESISPTTWATFVFFAAFPLFRVVSTRIQFRNFFPPSAGNMMTAYEINDEYLVFSFPGVREGKYYWNSFVHFAKNEKVALFYINKNRFLILPVGALSAPEQSELEALVSRHGVKSNP